MAFTLEDGTSVIGANAYVDTAYVDEYCADRAYTAWATNQDELGAQTAVTVQEKQAAIIRACDHMDKLYGTLYRGRAASSDQGLGWPRLEAYDDNDVLYTGIPDRLKKATSEYALRALLYGVLTPDPPPKGPRLDFTVGGDLPIYGEGEGEITSNKEKVGPVETETKYNPATSGSLVKHPGADMLMRPLLLSKSSQNVIYRG